MAKINDGFKQAEFDAWVATRPPVIQEMCRRLPPDRLYLIKSTGQRCTLHSYSENGTVTVDITGQYNRILYDRRVFGVDAGELEECDFPASDEPIGTILTTPEEVEAHITMRRAELGLPPRTPEERGWDD